MKIILSFLAIGCLANMSTILALSPTYIMSPTKWLKPNAFTPTVSSDDIANMFTKVKVRHPYAIQNSLTGKRAAADVVVTFSHPDLKSGTMDQALGRYGDETSLPHITALLDNSSLSIAYTESSESLIHKISKKMPRVTKYDVDATDFSSCSDYTDIISDVGTSSLINFYYTSSNSIHTVASINSCLSAITKTINSVAGDKYTILLTGATKNFQLSSTDDSLTKPGQYTFDEDDIEGPKYVTSTVITAAVVGFFLLITALIGFNCTLAIETPVRYANPSMVLPHTKEY